MPTGARIIVDVGANGGAARMILEKLRAGLLIVAGVIHLLPLVGLRGSVALGRLYGFEVSDPNLQIVLQHRALLFGLLGALLIGAAFVPRYQALAVGAGLISAGGFIVIAFLVGEFDPAIRRVVVADVVAVGCLLGAAVLGAVRG